MFLEYLEIMEEKSKKLEKPQIQAFSFMCEVIRRDKHDDQFIVRLPMPDGSARVAVMGNRKDLNVFLDSL